MKTLSIKQPWASLIAHGIKGIENRTWKTNYRGRIYIHASSKPVPFNGMTNGMNFTQDQLREVFKLHPVKDGRYADVMSRYLNGAIIGEVKIIDCVLKHDSIWAEKDCYNWVLANPVLYDKPILNVKGALSLWEYERPYEVIGTAEMVEGHSGMPTELDRACRDASRTVGEWNLGK